MSEGKRAYAAQLREQKVIFYKRKIKELIDRVQENPLGSDYSGELEKLHKENPKDRPLILQAEREAYKELVKK
jgi:hypothetical protein